jgi:hypothetical protein
VKMQAPRNDGVLRPDFAHRVVEQVRKARRRRQLYRWAVMSAVACVLGTLAIVSLPARNLHGERSTLLVSRNSSSHSERIASGELVAPPESDFLSFGQPLAFFFPGSSAVAEFQSSESTYWHSYDPWWNPAGTWASPAIIRSQFE